MRAFDTGAVRDTDETKLDYEGFLSPSALSEFAFYMHKNRELPDGSLRDSDNWQKGMPPEVYMKSLARHFFEVWLMHRDGFNYEGDPEKGEMMDSLCGMLFNVQGLLHTLANEEDNYE